MATENKIGAHLNDDQNKIIKKLALDFIGLEFSMELIRKSIKDFYSRYEAVSDIEIPMWWNEKNWEEFHKKDKLLFELVKKYSESVVIFDNESDNFVNLLKAIHKKKSNDTIGFNKEKNNMEKCIKITENIIPVIKGKLKDAEAGLLEVLKTFKPLVN